jgi:hypothetical protein
LDVRIPDAGRQPEPEKIHSGERWLHERFYRAANRGDTSPGECVERGNQEKE